MEKKALVSFVYSQIYDRILSEMMGSFDENQSVEVENFISLLSAKWENYEQKIIAKLKKYPPFDFEQEKVYCYLVKNLPYTGISDPLTIKIRPSTDIDIDLVVTTLIHELVHVFIEKEEAIITSNIKQVFPEVTEYRILLHIAVNFIEHEILKDIFDQETLDTVMKRELLLKGISPAWDVVLANYEKLDTVFK